MQTLLFPSAYTILVIFADLPQLSTMYALKHSALNSKSSALIISTSDIIVALLSQPEKNQSFTQRSLTQHLYRPLVAEEFLQSAYIMYKQIFSVTSSPIGWQTLDCSTNIGF